MLVETKTTYKLTMKDGGVKKITGSSYYEAMVDNPNISVWDIIRCEKILTVEDINEWRDIYNSGSPYYVRGGETFHEFLSDIQAMDFRKKTEAWEGVK